MPVSYWKETSLFFRELTPLNTAVQGLVYQGKPIPSIDAQIAAVARIHNLTVLTTDEHFNVVEGLNVENWL